MAPISVVIPAHNEAAVIGRTLSTLMAGAAADELQVVVVCNGCHDDTAARAKAAAPDATVLEIAVPSKIAALNAGDEAAQHFPRFYLDADVEVDIAALRATADLLRNGPVACAAPLAAYDLAGRPWAVRRYFEIWQLLPYFNDERIGGLYGLSEEGRGRFGTFPDLVADDQFVLQLFERAERRCLEDRQFVVQPPRSLRALVRNRTRVYRGNRQLAGSGLTRVGPTPGVGRALADLARQPRNWPGLATYTGVTVLAKLRARRATARWERDDSSRQADLSPSGPAPLRTAVGYVVGTYPAPSETFVSREIRAVRDLGTPVQVFTIHRAPERYLLSDLDREESTLAVALLPISAAAAARAHLAILARHPRAYLATLRTALSAAPGGLRSLLWQLFYFAEAGLLWTAARRQGTRRLHAHLANVAADVAWLTCELGRRAEPDQGWGWSFTMHGPTELFAVERFNLRRKIEAADAVICISDYCRSQLMMLSGEEHWEKLRVVHCGVDTAQFTPSARPGEAPMTVLCIGRLVPEKGQRILVRAVARLVADGRPVRLVLAGDGPMRPAIEADVARLGLADHVELLGAVGQDRLTGILAGADVFCLASFAEGVPIVLMEAMASGLPVVTTPIAGIPELVEDGVAGLLVPPGRVDALADALGELAKDPERRQQMGDAGRQKVQSEFELRTNAAHVREVLIAKI